MKHTGERGAFALGDFENNKSYNLSFCFNLKNGVIINICHLRRSQLEAKTKDFYQARCRMSLALSHVTKWYQRPTCSYPKHFRSTEWVCFPGMFNDMFEAGSLRSRGGTDDNTNVGRVIQGAPLNLPPHGARSLQGGRTYPPGHHSPGTHVPMIPCRKWSKASLRGLCGSSPSQGQAPRTEGWPWAASYWAMDVNKTWVSRLVCRHTFL